MKDTLSFKDGINVKQPLLENKVANGTFDLIRDPVEAINQNLKFLILTAPGERIRVPSFGVGIRNYLFEQFTPTLTNTIRESIIQQASVFMPYINIESVSFNTENIDSNRLGITLTYSANSRAFTNVIFSIEATI